MQKSRTSQTFIVGCYTNYSGQKRVFYPFRIRNTNERSGFFFSHVNNKVPMSSIYLLYSSVVCKITFVKYVFPKWFQFLQKVILIFQISSKYAFFKPPQGKTVKNFRYMTGLWCLMWVRLSHQYKKKRRFQAVF